MNKIKQSKSKKTNKYCYNHKQHLINFWNLNVVCECGCIVSKPALKKHLNTKKHQKLLLQNQNPIT